MSEITNWPHDADGNPMAIVIGSVKDVVKTAEYCAVHIGHTIMRPVPNSSRQDVIDAGRDVQQDCEYIVGCERFLLNMELKGTVFPVHPVNGERFAGVPNGYDPSKRNTNPVDIANAELMKSTES